MTQSENESRLSGIPSRAGGLLRSLLGRQIVGATRYSWWAPEEAQQRRRVPAQDLFSLTCGPVVLEFDTGLVLGVASNPPIKSICVWVEEDKASQSIRPMPIASNQEFHAIDAADPVYSNQLWRSLVGARVTMISILVRRPSTAWQATLPNEVGLCFTLDSGVRVVGANGLNNDSDDFVIIPEEMIMNTIRSELQELAIIDVHQ